MDIWRPVFLKLLIPESGSYIQQVCGGYIQQADFLKANSFAQSKCSDWNNPQKHALKMK